MHNRDKYPEIWAAFERATARKEELMAKRKVFTDQMQAKFEEQEAIRATLEELSVKAYEDLAEIREVSSECSRLAKAMGAKSLTVES